MIFKSFTIAKPKEGSAILIAISVIIILLILETYLMQQTRNNIVMKHKNTSELQSLYAAKGALQHALLKCRLMPTQLYDATCFSVGKNPYFDFTEYKIKPSEVFPAIQLDDYYIKLASEFNPGPRFITKGNGIIQTDEHEKWSTINAFTPEDLQKTSNIKPWPKDIDGKDIINPAIYLWKFYDDIRFDSDKSSIGSYPYKFQYNIESIKISSQQSQKKYDLEAIEIYAAGSTQDKNTTHKKDLFTVYKFNRNKK